MIQLQLILWVLAIFFGFIGFHRGWNKEIIATAGIVLALFALHQYDEFIRFNLFANFAPEQRFMAQAAIFGVVVFFAYQTRALIVNERRGAEGRDNVQESILGGLLGVGNGYLIWGSLWYFIDINGYPTTLGVYPPIDRTIIDYLPLYFLADGPTGAGDLLSLAVIILFLIVLIVI
jgi:hypothetical protein